jgi:hypothetical protein
MKIQIELDETQMIPYLTEMARDQIWHINYTIKMLRNNYTDSASPIHLFKDLQDFFATLDATNKLLVYHGGEPVELVCANVEVGYDLDGEPFNK